MENFVQVEANILNKIKEARDRTSIDIIKTEVFGKKGIITELFRKNKAGDDNKAAKIFYQLSANLKGGPTPLLDLEIRYKGSFTPQPQFQGNMTNELKKAIVAECVE